MAIDQVAAADGIVGSFVEASAFLYAIARLRRALWLNHRYRFSTLRWGRVLTALLVMGALLKLVMAE